MRLNLSRPSKKFVQWYVKYHFVLVLAFLPAYTVNLLVVYAFVTFNLHIFWILSSVVVGDIVAYEINVAFGVWLQIHWKYLHRIQLEAAQLEELHRK